MSPAYIDRKIAASSKLYIPHALIAMYPPDDSSSFDPFNSKAETLLNEGEPSAGSPSRTPYHMRDTQGSEEGATNEFHHFTAGSSGQPRSLGEVVFAPVALCFAESLSLRLAPFQAAERVRGWISQLSEIRNDTEKLASVRISDSIDVDEDKFQESAKAIWAYARNFIGRYPEAEAKETNTEQPTDLAAAAQELSCRLNQICIVGSHSSTIAISPQQKGAFTAQEENRLTDNRAVMAIYDEVRRDLEGVVASIPTPSGGSSALVESSEEARENQDAA